MGAFGFAGRARHRRHFALSRNARFDHILRDGWRLRWPGPGPLPTGAIAERAGFDGSGNAVQYSEPLSPAVSVREPWPDEANVSLTDRALEKYLYTSDSVSGLTNGSTLASPRPIAAWLMPSHLVVGDSVRWEIAAFHKDGRMGRQVACVRVRATDGTNATAWQHVASTHVSAMCEDAHPVEVYGASLDVSALPDGAAFWLEGEVLPWLGTQGAILRSEEISSRRGFSRRWFRRDTARDAAPPLAYVASTGHDGTGVISSAAATASASPFLTVGGAIDAARSQVGTTRGAIDGLRIRILDTVNLDSPNVSFVNSQDVAAVVIERAPATSRSNAIVTTNKPLRPQFTDHSSGIGDGALIFRDVTLRIGAASHTMKGEPGSNLFVQFWNTDIDYQSNSNNFRSSSDIAFFGMTAINCAGGLSASSSGKIRMLRGVSANLAGTNYTGWNVIGCALSSVGGVSYDDPTQDGHILCNNEFRGLGADVVPISFFAANPGDDLGSVAIVQNLVEMTAPVSATGLRLSADQAFGNVTHAVVVHNTVAGASGNGRFNLAYDEHPTVARQHRFISFKGNLGPQFNTKGDICSGSQGYPELRTGNLAFHHGVGCAGNYSENANASGDALSYGFAYPGPGTIIAGGDALFVDRQSVSISGETFTAGTGGGDYRLQAGSPARGILAEPVLGFDLAGDARGAGAQSAGCYV